MGRNAKLAILTPYRPLIWPQPIQSSVHAADFYCTTHRYTQAGLEFGGSENGAEAEGLWVVRSRPPITVGCKLSCRDELNGAKIKKHKKT